MNSVNTQPIVVNHFDRQSRARVLSQEPHLSTRHLNLQGINLDYYRHEPYEAPTHVTDHHVVCLILDKICLERRLDGQYRRERANWGSVAIMPANVEHWAAWETPAKFAIFSIQPKVLRKIALELTDRNRINLIPTFAKPEPDPLLASIGRAIEQHLATNTETCSFYIEHLMNAVSAHLLQNYCEIDYSSNKYQQGLPAYKLKQVIEYIKVNLHESIALKNMAESTGISQFYFCRLFRQSMGISPYKYVLQQRIKQAQKLIEQGSLTLVEIAYESGFSSQSQMTHHFRKAIGVTPKVYRDRL